MPRSSRSSSSSKRVRRTFTDEFKRDAVGLVTDPGYTLAEACRSLGVPPNLVRRWKQRIMSDDQPQKELKEDEKEELRRLRKENRKLRMEREILEKATAFFAKENQ